MSRPERPDGPGGAAPFQVVTTAVNNTRDLVNTPANHLNPVSFAEYAREHGEAAGLSVEVLDERALAKRPVRRHPGGRRRFGHPAPAGPAELPAGPGR